MNKTFNQGYLWRYCFFIFLSCLWMLFIPCITSLLSFIALSYSLSPSFFSYLLFKALSVPLICQHLLLSDTLPSQRGFTRLSLPDRSPLLKNSILPFIPGSVSVCVSVCQCAYCASVSWQTLWIFAPVCLSDISSADSWVNFDCDILSVSPLGSRCRSKWVGTNVEVYFLTEMVKEKTEVKLY